MEGIRWRRLTGLYCEGLRCESGVLDGLVSAGSFGSYERCWCILSDKNCINDDRLIPGASWGLIELSLWMDWLVCSVLV